jgi:hypothetical protein
MDLHCGKGKGEERKRRWRFRSIASNNRKIGGDGMTLA